MGGRVERGKVASTRGDCRGRWNLGNLTTLFQRFYTYSRAPRRPRVELDILRRTHMLEGNRHLARALF